MKYIFLIIIGIFLSSCTRPHIIPPNHFSINPSIELEIQEREPNVTRTGVNFSIEWDL